MENFVFLFFMLILFVVVIAHGVWINYKQRKWFIQKLCDLYGKTPSKEYKIERFARISGYYENHLMKNQLDDITWNDLSMDDIFKRVNYTITSTGEEYLYYLLRTPKQSEEDLRKWEELVAYFMNHPEERNKMLALLTQVGGTGKYSLYDYLGFLSTLGERSNLKNLLLNCGYIFLIPVMFINTSVGIVGILILLLYQIFSYFKEKKEIEPYITSLSYIMRLLKTAEKLWKLKLNDAPSSIGINAIKEQCKQMGKFKSGSFWALDSSNIGTAGNPLELIFTYVRMIFHVDLIIFNHMLKELRIHAQDIDGLVTNLGYIEATISIGYYRASIEHGLCCPCFTESDEFVIENGYHPLIEEPVKNSIASNKGVLLTGSNASGKSTFLKTIALSVVMAQTINTVLADSYHAPFYRIFSSMSLKDSIFNKESYYMAEIKSIKRILDSINSVDNNKSESEYIICFVDEVLRGTNTVERIAASTQILKSFGKKNVKCFAATHDVELTKILEEIYDNYHFQEEIQGNDVLFNYQLIKGKATTRNAIKLLDIIGYDTTIVKSAERQASLFLETGEWKLS